MLKRYLIHKAWELLSLDQRKEFLVILVLMLIGMVLETIGVGLVVPALALFTQKDIALKYPKLQPLLDYIGNPDQQTLVVGGLLVLLIVYVVKALFLAFLAWYENRFIFRLQADVSQDLFSTYLLKPYTFHLQRNSAKLIRNATTEVLMFTNKLMLPAIFFLREILVLAGLSVLLFIVEPLGATIVTIFFGALGFGFYRLTRKYLVRWGEVRKRHEGMRIQQLQQGLGGVKDVKVLGRENDFLSQYEKHNRRVARVGQLEATMQKVPKLWVELIAVGTLVVLVLTMLAKGGTLELIIPKIGLFAVAAFRLMPSFNRIMIATQAIKFSQPVLDMLAKELEPVSMEKTVSRKEENFFRHNLIFENVSYTYPGSGSLSLDNVSLSIKKGESVGFVGASGAGKSTLVDLLLGLLPPSGGSILVDGKDIQKDLPAWQRQIGYVPQSIFLIDDTIRRNVAFGVPLDSIDDNAVRKALKAAQLEQFVDNLSEGVETMVGERGIRLSGGQRQRIGIARALYHDPEVLVLDEATSALDGATERSVMDAVNLLHGDKTIIIVAHRLSTVERCKCLYRLEKGRIVDEGVPENIIESLRTSQGVLRK